MDVDEYAKLAGDFDAADYDPRAWAAAAKAAGMKYMVLTTRHHDGFCLFDSKVSDFTSVKTAARRDLVAEYVEACRGAGLKVGFYYSPLDWRFPGFFFPNMYRRSAEALKRQTYDQIRELMTNYGRIDVLWYDGGSDGWLGLGGLEWGGDKPGWHQRAEGKPYRGRPLWEPEKLNAMVRELQPKIVINDRSGWPGDFETREFQDGDMQTARPWERCTTLAGGWGWSPNAKMRSREDCIQQLARIAGRDGNLLLNVGPTPAGVIEPRQVRRLAEVGEWLEVRAESIYGTRGGPVRPGKWGAATHRDNRVYLHVLEWPDAGPLSLPALEQRIVATSVLPQGAAAVRQTGKWMEIDVPAELRDPADTVVVLECEGSVSRP